MVRRVPVLTVVPRYDAGKIRLTSLGLSFPVYKVGVIIPTLESPHYLMLLLFLQVTPFKTFLGILTKSGKWEEEPTLNISLGDGKK